jgi:putative ABC transport system substrate-binding protein
MTTARNRVVVILILALLAWPLGVAAQQARIYRVGVVTMGGPYEGAVDGLRDGLKELGLEEGKQVILHVRDLRGDPKAVAPAAKGLEAEKVDLIYSVNTSVTVETKRVTRSVPMAFYVGSDPVAVGLVESIRRPGGRLTGIYSRSTPLVAKRFELLKEMVPGLRRVAYFYNPASAVTGQNIALVRDAARELKVHVVERRVGSVDELRAGLEALKPGEVDGLLYLDGMAVSQTGIIVDAARTKKLPTIGGDRTTVVRGGLASYGVSYYTVGRLVAKQVQQILLGAKPGDMPIEQVDRLHLAINLKTAKALGVTIPPSVLIRADEVIE